MARCEITCRILTRCRLDARFAGVAETRAVLHVEKSSYQGLERSGRVLLGEEEGECLLCTVGSDAGSVLA